MSRRQPTNKKGDAPDKKSANNTANNDPPDEVTLEKALLACMPDDSPSPPPVAAAAAAASAALYDQHTNGYNVNRANTEYYPSEKENDEDLGDVALPRTSLVRNTTQRESSALSSIPGAWGISGSGSASLYPSSSAGADYVDPLDPLHVMVNEEQERAPGSSASAVDVEHEDRQQRTQTNVVSAYRVAEQEPAIIIATPFKDNKVLILIYGFLVTAAVALIVGLSVGLTTKNKEEPPISIPMDRLVSSVNVMAKQEGSFMKANRYHRTENGKEIVSTTGSAVLNRCEVIPCNEGGCDLSEKVYEPGCCRGPECNPADRCGPLCPQRANLCHPSFVGCTDASCFECERGPSGEELYQYRSASFDINCLRTGVATGFNDEDDTVPRIYKWAIVCGYNVRGGNEWQNYAPGEYVCIAVRTGNGITKTLSLSVPCQIIQLGECGCAPGDVHTLGLPPPTAPCKTKQDCPYLCGDAGLEEAKTLCEAFPGIEWWEGKNPLGRFAFFEPAEDWYGNVTEQIDIYGE